MLAALSATLAACGMALVCGATRAQGGLATDDLFGDAEEDSPLHDVGGLPPCLGACPVPRDNDPFFASCEAWEKAAVSGCAKMCSEDIKKNAAAHFCHTPDHDDLNARTIHGLSVLGQQGPESAEAFDLLSGCDERDWVAHSWVGVYHAIAGRRAMAEAYAQRDAAFVAGNGVEGAPLAPEDQVWRPSYAKAIDAWTRMEHARDLPAHEQLDPYPQATIPHGSPKRETLLVDWINLLHESGRSGEVPRLREKGRAEGFWLGHPMCFPHFAFETADWAQGKDHPEDKRFFHDAGAFFSVPKLAAGIPAMQEELEAFRAGGNTPQRPPCLRDACQEPTGFIPVSEATDTMSGTGHFLMKLGALLPRPCASFPRTCELIDTLPDLFINNATIKFSSLRPGTTIYPHCGPTNGRLRIHCALDVPTGQGGEEVATFFVGTDSRTWVEGECFVFDESCEHRVEVSSTATKPRTVLIADIANPFLANVGDYVEQFTAAAMDRTGLGAVRGMHERGQELALSTLRGGRGGGGEGAPQAKDEL